MGFSWKQGLAVVFLSGATNIIFTLFQVRQNVIDAIPSGLKRAMATSVGVFVATIGLQIAHIVSYRGLFIDLSQTNVESLTSHTATILYLGFAIALLLYSRAGSFPLGMLLSIVTGIFLCAIWHIQSHFPAQNLSTSYFSAFGKMDFSVFHYLKSIFFIAPIIVLFVIDFVGGAGKLIGLTAATNIVDKHGNVPNLRKGLLVDGGGTILGSILGTSSLVVFVESAVGINAGGRTGLTAIVCGLLIGASFLFAPLLKWVPPEAVTGVLVFVAYLLSPWKIDPNGAIEHTRFDFVVGLVMAIVAFLTFGIYKAMAVGFWCYFLANTKSAGDLKKTGWIGAFALILTVTSIGQYFIMPKHGIVHHY